MQNTFCYAFPIFMSIFEKLWISPQNQSLLRCRIPKNVLETQKNFNSSRLGHRNLRCPSRLELKSKLGAQAEIHLGHRNLRCPRRNSSWAPQLTVPKPAGIKIKIRRPSRNSSWAPQLTVPKKEFILGTATYGAQEGHGLGVKSKILFMRSQK